MSSPASATHPLAGHAGAHAHPDMDATYRKITWRLIPFLVFLFVLAWKIGRASCRERVSSPV